MRMASVVYKMRETRMRWLVHVKGECTDVSMRRCKRLTIVSIERRVLGKSD